MTIIFAGCVYIGVSLLRGRFRQSPVNVCLVFGAALTLVQAWWDFPLPMPCRATFVGVRTFDGRHVDAIRGIKCQSIAIAPLLTYRRITRIVVPARRTFELSASRSQCGHSARTASHLKLAGVNSFFNLGPREVINAKDQAQRVGLRQIRTSLLQRNLARARLNAAG